MLLLLVALLAPGGETEAPVVVYGDRQQTRDARDATLATTTVPLEADPRPLTSVGQALEGVPGVVINRAGSEGRAQILSLRGAGGHQVAVFLDGVPLVTARGQALDLSTLPLAAIDRVEVARGAAAAAYGSAAQGGVLHLRTKRGGASGIWGALRGGSFGLAQSDLGLQWATTNTDGLAAARIERAEGDFEFIDDNGVAGVRQNNAYLRVGALARERWRPGPTGEVTALVEGLFDTRGEPGSVQQPSVGAEGTQRRGVASLAWRDVGLGAGTFTAEARGHLAYRDYRFTDDAPTFAGGVTAHRLTDTDLGLTTHLTYEGSGAHRPQLTAELRHETAETGADTLRTETRTRAAAMSAWQLFPADGLELVGALRLDTATGRDPIWVGKAGAVWRPLDGLLLRSNWGRLFRDPSVDELYFEGVGIRGNPDLRPEDGVGGDVSLALVGRLWGARTHLELGGFHQRFDRLIQFRPLDAYRLRADDTAAATIQGLEAAGILRRGRAELRVDYLLQDTRTDADPQPPLPFRPRHRVTLRTSAPLGPLVLFSTLMIRSEVTTDAFGNRTQPGYTRVDAGLRWTVTDTWSVGAEVHNLADVKGYADAVHRPLPGRAVYLELKRSAPRGD